MEAEAVQAKPRLTYAEFVAAQQPKYTLSFVIQRVIDDVLANAPYVPDKCREGVMR